MALVSASDAVQILRRQCCLGTGAKLKEEEKKKVTIDDEGEVIIAPPPRMVLIIMTLVVMIDTAIVVFDLITFYYGLQSNTCYTFDCGL